MTSKSEYSHVRWEHEWPESAAKKMRKDKPSSSVKDKTSTISDSSSDDSCDFEHQPVTVNTDEEKVTEGKHVDLSDLLKMSAVQMASVDSVELHRHLKVVDAVTANRMHPNNKRKIIR